jgi:hypothetical protein
MTTEEQCTCGHPRHDGRICRGPVTSVPGYTLSCRCDGDTPLVRRLPASGRAHEATDLRPWKLSNYVCAPMQIAAVVRAARDMHEHMVSAHPQQACASCGLRIKGLSEALGALDTK